MILFFSVFPFSCFQIPVVVVVTLKVHMHCEACAQGLKKRIRRMKGKRKTQMGSNRVDQFSVENVMGFQGRMIFLLFPHFPQVMVDVQGC